MLCIHTTPVRSKSILKLYYRNIQDKPKSIKHLYFRYYLQVAILDRIFLFGKKVYCSIVNKFVNQYCQLFLVTALGTYTIKHEPQCVNVSSQTLVQN